MARKNEGFEEELQSLIRECQELEERFRTERRKWRSICGDDDPFEFATNLIKKCERLEMQLRNLQNSLVIIRSERDSREAEFKEIIEANKKLILKLKEKLEALTAPPLSFAKVWQVNEDGTIDVIVSGERKRVNIDPDLDKSKLELGGYVLVNGMLNIVGYPIPGDKVEHEKLGEEVKIKAFLDGNRAIVIIHDTEEKVIQLSKPLIQERESEDLKLGDKIVLDSRGVFGLLRLPKAESEEVVLEEIPNVTFNDIGGIDDQIKMIKEKIIEPYLYPEVYARHNGKAPKGICLHGEPGNGKTMLGKAIARYLTDMAKEKGFESKGNFLLVNGPELSHWLVGRGEYQIRELFRKARERQKLSPGVPVVLFFDEAEGFLAQRGSRISSDVEKDYVNQFSTCLDGVEETKNVIIVVATNRIDLLDRAILRPGRLDFKVRIGAPNEKGARDIFTKYITHDLPFDKKYFDRNEYPQLEGNLQKIADYLIDKAVERIYHDKQGENKFVELTLRAGHTTRKEVLYFKEFISGAAIKNIVDRAKSKAIRAEIDSGKEVGLRAKFIYESIEEEFLENESLPNTLEAIKDWAKMKGIREEIVDITPLLKKRVTGGEETKIVPSVPREEGLL